jgi:hypothetical protein
LFNEIIAATKLPWVRLTAFAFLVINLHATEDDLDFFTTSVLGLVSLKYMVKEYFVGENSCL